MVWIIKNRNINDSRTKLNNLGIRVSEISLSNIANVSQSEFNEMHCISYSAREYKRHTYLCFEEKQIQFALGFNHIL